MIATAICEQDKQHLHKTFNSIAAFDQQAFNAMLPHWRVINCKRKTIITAIGDTERYLYLVTDGIQRGYCTYQGKDATIIFFYPYSFAGIADSFYCSGHRG